MDELKRRLHDEKSECENESNIVKKEMEEKVEQVKRDKVKEVNDIQGELDELLEIAKCHVETEKYHLKEEQVMNKIKLVNKIKKLVCQLLTWYHLCHL